MEERMNQQQWALFMFISLTQQADAWSYALKGTLNAKSKHFLNKYMRNANEFSQHIAKYYDMDELHEQSVVWSDLMNYIRTKSHTDQERLYWGLRDFFHKIENNHEAWHKCEKCETNYDLRIDDHCPNCSANELS
jgi:hypothetical protein